VQGIELTCIDNGMPVVLLRAADVGKTGYEAPAALEDDAALRERIESLRLALGPRMNLGEVAKKTVPKMCLLAPARAGGTVSTRTFIPHRVHEAMGVLGAVSVASACALPGSIASEYVEDGAGATRRYEIEHPSGHFSVDLEADFSVGVMRFRRAALLRTARLLMRGEVMVPSAVWSGTP
jgi:4-oxalomesaconate tautomerase